MLSRKKTEGEGSSQEQVFKTERQTKSSKPDPSFKEEEREEEGERKKNKKGISAWRVLRNTVPLP